MTLVILAAGLGSRFGGLKQVEGIGPNNEFIIDYSIYDAYTAGFDKIVMIIKEEHKTIFEETISKRWKSKIKIEYAYQFNKNIENLVPKDRVKPLGTLHAIVCAKDKINEDFAIINADDFYGRDSFIKAVEFLKNNNNYCASFPYVLKNTLSINGSVNRGICTKDENGFLTHIEETLNIQTDGNKIYNDKNIFKGNELVSMNFFCIKKELLNLFEKEFQIFLNTANLLTDECYIPVVLSKLMEKGLTKIKIIEVNAKWHGMTNKEDLYVVKKSIKNYIENEIYPNNLWA